MALARLFGCGSSRVMALARLIWLWLIMSAGATFGSALVLVRGRCALGSLLADRFGAGSALLLAHFLPFTRLTVLLLALKVT